MHQSGALQGKALDTMTAYVAMQSWSPGLPIHVMGGRWVLVFMGALRSICKGLLGTET